MDADRKQIRLEKAVQSAVGFNAARGDMISVEAISFSTELADRQKREEQELAAEQQRAMWFKIATGVVAALAVMYVVRVLMRRRQQEEEEFVEIPVQPQPTSIIEQAKDLSAAEKERLSQREAIAKMAKNKPDEVAQLVKAWINEE
jgi:flagellar M-ring protein FliF